MSSPHIAFASPATPISAAATAGQITTTVLRPVPESAVQPRAFHYTFSTTTTTAPRPVTDSTRPPSSLKKLSPSPLPASATPQPSPNFLPRTSSLLPAARAPVKLSSPVVNNFAFPSNAFDAGAKSASTSASASASTSVSAPVILSPPESATPPPASPVRHRPFHGPSRSNSSARAAPDSVRGGLHHRWSTSTGSSHASAVDGRPLVYRHQRSASFSRRLSIDSTSSSLHRTAAAAGESTSNAAPSTAPTSASPVQQHTPRKLQKSRPSTAHTGSPHRASPRPLTDRELPPVPPTAFESLPPIVALPSLEQELQNSPASLLGRTTTTPPPTRPRAHIRHPSSEDNIRSFYFGNAPPPAAATVTEKRPASALASSLPPRKQPAAASTATMQFTGEPKTSRPSSRGYGRNRSETTKGSTDSTKSRGNRPPSQKAMLSRALQKAHTAVQLDNAGNFEGAREAYTEACELLQQVLYKTPGQEDKQKLEAIRETYTARIDELDQLQLVSVQTQDTRPLPQRPQDSVFERQASADAYPSDDAHVVPDDDAHAEEEAVIETVAVTRVYNNDSVSPEAIQPRSIPSYSVPLAAAAASASASSSSPRLMQSAFSTAASSSPRPGASLLNDQYPLQSSFSRSPRPDYASPNRAPAWANASANTLQPPATINPYMPPPLSPRRIAPPPRPFEDAPTYGVTARNAPGGSGNHNGLHIHNNNNNNNNNSNNNSRNGMHGHTRVASHESVSCLDPINESGSSAPSSVHSRSSSLKVRRKHIRASSGATEAEFDAALDDAIEAAYDDGYEPMLPATAPMARPSNFGTYRDDNDPISSSMRRVELAKERVRETEREAQAFERQFRLREQLRQQQQLEEEEEEEEAEGQQRSPSEWGLARRDITTNLLSTGDDSEDEERLLEEMTTAIEDFSFDTMGPMSKPPPPPMQKPPLPREPDTSEGSLQGWHRPMTPNAAITAAAAYEHNGVVSPPSLVKGPTYAMPPPPTAALPQLPPQPHRLATNSQSPARAGSAMSVRSRRLSGQTMKQLKIETTKLGPPPMFNGGRPPATTGSAAVLQQPPRTTGGFKAQQQRQALSAGPRPGSSTGPRPGSSAGPRPGSSAATGASMSFSMRQGPAAGFGASPTAEHMPPPNFPPPTPPIPQGASFGENDSTAGRSGSPSTGRPGLRKNFSSSSLRSLRSRNMSVTNLDSTSNVSPGTPLSNNFVPSSSSSRPPEVPSLPAGAAALKDRATANAAAASAVANATGGGVGVGSMRLLENDFHSPTTPGSPNVLAADAPVPLEACPTDMLLRPFWLMRCLYQTLAHPRGGYLSNKLFVPSDVWRVKGVKLKNVDEKVANCEVLTEALQSLARVVDEYDADAVLKEMEALESVLEQVQAVLARRLGSEVGVQSTHALFRDASPLTANDHEGTGSSSSAAGAAGAAAAGAGAASASGGGSGSGSGGSGGSGGGAVPRTSSVSNNARSFSWRRLRPKNSSAGLNSGFSSAGASGSSRKDGGGADGSNSTGGGGGGHGGTAAGGTLASLPMTPHPTSRPAKRDVAAVRFAGPNAAYMRALARLFDAAQLIDQVARQVEDPGLRHADQTQVGLELSTRHAAEFFAFYICRFVLSDVSLLLEKFIKRGSEWVLS